MAASSNALSATVRPIGPCTPFVDNPITRLCDATRPGVGRIPVTPQKADGLRMLAPESDPLAMGAIPVARATPAPPDDPPQVRVVSNGLPVGPNTRLVVFEPTPNSGELVLPKMTAPWRRIRATTGSSLFGTLSL